MEVGEGMRVCPREVTQSLHGYITLVGQGQCAAQSGNTYKLVYMRLYLL